MEETKDKTQEEENKEEHQKEEEKKDEPKVEEETTEKPKEPEKPREPEPKIPTDLTNEIASLKKLKEEGNELIQTDVDSAILKYEEGKKLADEYTEKFNKENDYNPQVKELITFKKKIYSNLGFCYLKKEQYQKAIDINVQIIGMDPDFDKAYYMLFKSYMGLGNRGTAVYFGKLLKSRFLKETLQKYNTQIEEIDKEDEILQKEFNEMRAKERSKMIQSALKYLLPVIILLVAGAIYFFYLKKKNKISE